MAGGWESKSVEQQQAEAEITPVVLPAKAAGNTHLDAQSKRRRQELELQRERILSERTSSAHRRSALTNALADVEEKLAELGWTIHL